MEKINIADAFVYPMPVALKSGYITSDLLLGAGIALLLALVLGTVFCSWVCHFGVLSE
jgi:ferredoxin-type protein NapH